MLLGTRNYLINWQEKQNTNVYAAHYKGTVKWIRASNYFQANKDACVQNLGTTIRTTWAELIYETIHNSIIFVVC
jgi:hypothetical protein